MVNSLPITKAIIETEYRNLSICPANIDLTGAEVELISLPEREKILSVALQEVRDTYDYVIIDCPPSLGQMTVNALTASDYILIPVQAEYYALEGLEQLLETYSRVKNSSNPSLKFLGIVITMFDARTQLAHQVEEEVRSLFPEQVFQTIIPRNVRLSEAPSRGQPIMVYDKRSRGAKAYKALTKEIMRKKKVRS